jgi:hypothetical protein
MDLGGETGICSHRKYAVLTPARINKGQMYSFVRFGGRCSEYLDVVALCQLGFIAERTFNALTLALSAESIRI